MQKASEVFAIISCPYGILASYMSDHVTDACMYLIWIFLAGRSYEILGSCSILCHWVVPDILKECWELMTQWHSNMSMKIEFWGKKFLKILCLILL